MDNTQKVKIVKMIVSDIKDESAIAALTDFLRSLLEQETDNQNIESNSEPKTENKCGFCGRDKDADHSGCLEIVSTILSSRTPT